jgi:hypothetical protein
VKAKEIPMHEVDSTPPTSLDEIWPLQAALNARAGFDTAAIGGALRDAQSSEDASPEALLEVGRAMKNYLDALSGECHELQDCLSWKHWYREAKQGRQYALTDVQNARVEVVDILFFWVSLCQLLGLEPADVFRLYAAKLGINHRRQDQDRSQAEHGQFEHENRNVR